jgi:membrane-bound inhibitor of C-type lysozyme
MLVIAGAAVWYTYSKPGKGPPGRPSLSVAARVTYICNDGETMEATFYKGQPKPIEPGEPPAPSGRVKLVLSDGRNLDLPQTISADGSRYANSDESFVFWIKGDGAIVRENNIEKRYVRFR